MPDHNSNPAWIAQPDGTYLPSQELLAKVRNNPLSYPDAAKDFAVMTGKSEDEVQFILDNPFRGGGWIDWVVPDWYHGVSQGARNAAGWAVENVGNLAGIDGADEAGRYIRRETGFATEKGIPERIGEFAGQVAPSVAAGIATGGAGPAGMVAGTLVGSAVGAATYDPHDPTAIDVLDQLTDIDRAPAN